MLSNHVNAVSNLLFLYLMWMFFYSRLLINSLEYQFAKIKPSEEALKIYLDSLKFPVKLLFYKEHRFLNYLIGLRKGRSLFAYLQNMTSAEITFGCFVSAIICSLPNLVILYTFLSPKSPFEILNGVFWLAVHISTFIACWRFGRNLSN